MQITVEIGWKVWYNKMVIEANGLHFSALNEKIRQAGSKCCITGCLGQRFIAAGMQGKNITIEGIPGNALGAYFGGGRIDVIGNAQDAVGDTMNDGEIIVRGSIGDAVGYAMRGGTIYIRGDAGYRAGIHMKEYREKKPAIVIGGCAGSFLGEYQAGGLIIVLGLDAANRPIVGNFPCTGMHGGKMVLRGEAAEIDLPPQVTKRAATKEDLAQILPYLMRFCAEFSYDLEELAKQRYTVIVPNSKTPYKQMYVAN